MKQEDVNELISMNPSPEARIQFEVRRADAILRCCRCCDSNAFWDSECFFSDHKLPSVSRK